MGRFIRSVLLNCWKNMVCSYNSGAALYKWGRLLDPVTLDQLYTGPVRS